MNEEQLRFEERLKDYRVKEQRENKDYNEDMERCDGCGSLLNSHDNCPRCDY